MAIVLVALTAASACASIPTSGPIEEGDQVRASVDDPLIRVLPRPPQDGLSREQVVSGFLSASASFDDDHAVAREYLTERASAQWDSSSGVAIYDDDVGLTTKVLANSVHVRGRQVGTIGSDGAFTTRGGEEVRRWFRVTREGGQWRISRLADGLLLTRLDVDRTYRSYSLEFLAPGQDRLVPDPVYVPVDRAGASTSLTRALLDGPTRWLAPAVSTAIPVGTQLVVDAVPVENGVAQVNLTSDALQAVDEAREQMVAQLVWTLTDLPDVTGVEVSVEGAPLPMPESPAVQTQQAWAAFNPDYLPDSGAMLLVRKGVVYRVAGDTATPLSGPLGSGGADVSFPTSSADGSLVAALTADGHRAVLSDRFSTSELETVLEGDRLAPPSMDASGGLWLVERQDAGSRLWYKPADGKLHEVRAPDLESQRITQFAVALDGTRAVVVVAPPKVNGDEQKDAPTRPTLFLCRIVQTGDTVSVQAPRPLAGTISRISDVSWSSSESLVVLGRAAGAVLQPYEIGLDGTASEVGGAALQGIVGITAAPGFPLVAATRDDGLWQDSGAKWRPWLPGRQPAYPG